MISQDDCEFISKKMKISLESINTKLKEDCLSIDRYKIESAISFFIQAITNQHASGYEFNFDTLEDSPAEIEINNYYSELHEEITTSEAKIALDSIRHAFASFAYNGLHQLFTHQENEYWYPKIILDCELKPNNIDSLPEIIIIYRGTDISEYNNSEYGQSWTTNEHVAREFAFTHYADQDWFTNENRIILKTSYPRNFVYYANLAPEYEVAIDTSKIGKFELIR